MAGKVLDEAGLAELWSLIKEYRNSLLNEYLWERYKDISTAIVGESEQTTLIHTSSTSMRYVKCSDSYTIKDGGFVLDNPVSVGVSWSSNENISSIYGKYYIPAEGTSQSGPSQSSIIYLADSSNTYTKNGDDGYKITISAKKLTLNISEERSYLVSKDENFDFPSDGYAYIPKGKFAQHGIVSGAYIGNGEYGADAKCVVNVDFTPMAIAICYDDTQNSGIIPRGVTSAKMYSSSDNNATIEWGEKSVSWYSTTGSITQLNTVGNVYRYIVFG